jgi:hypothetical protein
MIVRDLPELWRPDQDGHPYKAPAMPAARWRRHGGPQHGPAHGRGLERTRKAYGLCVLSTRGVSHGSRTLHTHRRCEKLPCRVTHDGGTTDVQQPRDLRHRCPVGQLLPRVSARCSSVNDGGRPKRAPSDVRAPARPRRVDEQVALQWISVKLTRLGGAPPG